MLIRPLLPAALLLALAACGGEIADDLCELYNAPDPATTPFAAKIDGRQFAVGGDLVQLTGTYHPDTDELEFYGSLFHEAYWQEMVFVALPGVNGPGVYPIDARTPGQLSQAYYWCESSDKGHLNSTGAPGDSVWITSFDTLTGAISGTFSFHAVGEFDGEAHAITDGTFQLQVEIHHHPPIDTLPIPVDTLLRAFVDEDEYLTTSGSGTASFTLDTVASAVNLIARRIRDGVEEIIHLTLWGFDGIGAYPLTDYWGEGHSALAGYGTTDHAYWSDGAAGDTVWVTTYDSLSGRIKGTFDFRGGSGGDTVVVTEGTFRGTVSAYEPPEAAP